MTYFIAIASTFFVTNVIHKVKADSPDEAMSKVLEAAGLDVSQGVEVTLAEIEDIVSNPVEVKEIL